VGEAAFYDTLGAHAIAGLHGSRDRPSVFGYTPRPGSTSAGHRRGPIPARHALSACLSLNISVLCWSIWSSIEILHSDGFINPRTSEDVPDLGERE
jgi:hypothetical protein